MCIGTRKVLSLLYITKSENSGVISFGLSSQHAVGNHQVRPRLIMVTFCVKHTSTATGNCTCMTVASTAASLRCTKKCLLRRNAQADLTCCLGPIHHHIHHCSGHHHLQVHMPAGHALALVLQPNDLHRHFHCRHSICLSPTPWLTC